MNYRASIPLDLSDKLRKFMAIVRNFILRRPAVYNSVIALLSVSYIVVLTHKCYPFDFIGVLAMGWETAWETSLT